MKTKRQIRNPQFEIRNSVIRNPQFAVRNPQFAIHKPQFAIGNPKFAVRNQQSAVRNSRWAIILAGGDGTRLRSLTRAIAGDDRPKQFCPILGNETLLEQTRRRISLAVPSRQTLLSLTEAHRKFFAPTVKGMTSVNLVVQPSNLGTTPAILYSLLRLSMLDPTGTVAFFPSDHYFADGQGFMRHVDSAFRAVSMRPEMIVLLGIEADRPEIEYGWIEPAASIFGHLPRVIRRVKRFWEKPTAPVAMNFWKKGFLWNSFVMVGRVDVFLKMVQRAVPEIYQAFEQVRPALGTEGEIAAMERLYSSIGPSNFSHEVLATRAADLSVMSVKDVGWSDWGDPSRVLSTLARIGIEAQWAETAS